jgi:hypothetical protein
VGFTSIVELWQLPHSDYTTTFQALLIDAFEQVKHFLQCKRSLQCQRVATILTPQTIAGKERDWFHATGRLLRKIIPNLSVP